METTCRCGHRSHLKGQFVKNDRCLILECDCRKYEERTIIDIQKDWVRIENPKDDMAGLLECPEGCGPGVLTLPVGDSCNHCWGVWIAVRQKPWLQPRLYHAICSTCHRTKSFEPERESNV